jgi:hypothetical protein
MRSNLFKVSQLFDESVICGGDKGLTQRRVIAAIWMKLVFVFPVRQASPCTAWNKRCCSHAGTPLRSGISCAALTCRCTNAPLRKRRKPGHSLTMTLGGFVGNFTFSLMDHAGNGFFNPAEWIPVGASALAIGFLLTPLLVKVSQGFLSLCAVLLQFEAAISVWALRCASAPTSEVLPCTPSTTSYTELRPLLLCYFQMWWH